MANRKRNNGLYIMLSDDEYDMVKEKAQKAGMGIRDFFLSCIENSKFVIIEDLKEVAIEIKKQGSNLNQALRYTHDSLGRHLDPLDDTIRKCNSLYSRLLEIVDIVREKVRK